MTIQTLVACIEHALTKEATAIITFTYTNYKGETDERQVEVGFYGHAIAFAESEWHPERQWLFNAVDLARGAERTFAVKDMSNLRSMSRE